MNGKGSARRPSQVSQKQVAENWERTFGGGGEQWRKFRADLRDAWERPHPGRAVPVR